MHGAILNASLLALYMTISSLGLYALKTANGAFNAGFVTGLALYGIGFLVWYGLLARMPLSVAFPLAAGSLVIATQIVGALFLGENIPFSHLGGIALILAGIAIVFIEA